MQNNTEKSELKEKAISAVRDAVILQLLHRLWACCDICCIQEGSGTDNSQEEALGRVVSLQKEEPCK
jgi:hypothetical protein